MPRNAIVLALVALSLPALLIAQAPPGAERILVPIFTREPLPGAFGSQWSTDLWVTNDGDTPIGAGGFESVCIFPVCELDPRLPPRTTIRVRLYERPDGRQGTFIVADGPQADRLSFNLRFRDLSRQSATWGTEVPVVREGEFRAARFSLMDVPLTEGFRSVLRIYELNDTGRSALVRVRVYSIDPSKYLTNSPVDQLIKETVYPLQFLSPGNASAFPGYLAVDLSGSVAPVASDQRVRLEIEPATEGLRLWGFVTVVHNESQHATVVTPQ